MEDCAFTNRLDAYHDGELRPAERSALEAHLAGCDACAQALEFRRRLSAALRAAPAAGPDERTMQALVGRARAVPARARQQDLVRLGWGLCAAAAAALVIGLLLPQERRTRRGSDDWTQALAAVASRTDADLVAEGGEEAELALAIIEGLDGRVAPEGGSHGR